MELKCEATGKVRFNSEKEAKESMFRFRFTWKILRQGKRRKHRQGKPAQKRSYFCEHCNGYHQTSWEPFRPKEHLNPILKELIIYKNYKEL